MPAKRRPDVPHIDPFYDEEKGRPRWRLHYPGRGWSSYDTRVQALEELDDWLFVEIDQQILYLDELRRLRNRVTKQLKDPGL